MTPAQLTQNLEQLTHQDRVRRLINLGNIATTDPKVNQILHTLEKGDFSGRSHFTLVMEVMMLLG